MVPPRIPHGLQAQMVSSLFHSAELAVTGAIERLMEAGGADFAYAGSVVMGADMSG